MATEFDPEEVIRQVTESLSKKFPAQQSADIESQVRSEVDLLKDRPIHDYVSVLAERAVKHKLKRLANEPKAPATDESSEGRGAPIAD